MRPLAISVQAFGSYAEREYVDFERLEEHRFFLVCGPTGAGKTTLFDAISFALYGETSGGERAASQMRSDLADPSLATEVSLCFGLGDSRYRVTRSPRQARPKQRGDGTTQIEARAELVELADDGEHALASGSRAVTEKIIELLGFRADQFRQVVLLPQGGFERLLKADSKERQRLLDALFDTSRFAQLEQALRDEAKVARQQVEALHLRRQTIIAEGGGASMAELEARQAELGPQLERLSEELKTRSEQTQQAEAALTEARRVAELLEERRCAESALQEVQGRDKELAPRRSALALARRAAPLAERKHVLDERRREFAATRERVREAIVLRDQSDEQLQRAVQTLAEEHAREETRKQTARQLQLLEAMVGQAAELAETHRATRAAEQQLDALGQRWHALVERDRELSDAATERRQALTTTREQAQGLELLQLAAEAAERQLSQRQDLEAERERYDEALAQQRRIGARHDELAASARKLRDDLLQQERAWLQGQAVVLARRLKSQQACPVCGSLEHPQPAEAGTAPLPEEETLDRLRISLDHAEAERQDVQAAHELARTALVQARTRAETYVEVLGLFARQPVEIFAEQARARAKDVQRAEQAAARATRLQEELKAGEAELEKLKQERQQLTEERAEQRSQVERLRALLGERERGIPERLREPQQLEQELERIRRQADALSRALSSAERTQQRASAQAQVASKQLEASERAQAEAALRVDETQRELLARCQAAGFETLEALAEACLDEAALRALEALLEGHDGALAAARARVERLRESAGELAEPALLELSEAARRARTQRDETLGALATAQQQLRDLDGRLARLRETSSNLDVAEARYQRIGRVADVASGKNPRRTTFQRFVLAALLEDVLIAASERLRKMTRGRFSLQRAEEHRGGLDLEVTDSATGTVRAPVTLSGGETFLASLALALGLADVVQAHAGGVRLETIFVDEGFGGLDSEALDHALAALVDLQRAGKRVGIISHVAELRERIDARLEVVPGPRGSHVRLVVP